MQTLATQTARKKKNRYKALQIFTLISPIIFALIFCISHYGFVYFTKKAFAPLFLIFLAVTFLKILFKAKATYFWWLVILIMHLALQDVLVPLCIIMFVTSILDIIFENQYKKYKHKYEEHVILDEREAKE